MLYLQKLQLTSEKLLSLITPTLSHLLPPSPRFVRYIKRYNNKTTNMKRTIGRRCHEREREIKRMTSRVAFSSATLEDSSVIGAPNGLIGLICGCGVLPFLIFATLLHFVASKCSGKTILINQPRSGLMKLYLHDDGCRD